MITKKRELAWGIVLGIVGLLMVSCNGYPFTSTQNPAPQPDAVALRVQFPTPHSSKSFTVVVTNGESQPISVQDHQTDCTILLVEYQTNGQWHPLHKCAVMTPTISHSIPSGQTLTVSFNSASWPASTYHIKLAYVLGQQASPRRTAYSAAFILPQ